jgi:hypothetical protein
MTNKTATLIRQLGPALPMMGARDLVETDDGLQFGIRGCRKGNKIRIALCPDDTYSVELWSVKGWDVSQIGETVELVHVESLHSVLESLTGLYVRL